MRNYERPFYPKGKAPIDGGVDLGGFSFWGPDPISDNEEFWRDVERECGWQFSRAQRHRLCGMRGSLLAHWDVGPDGGPPQRRRIRSHLNRLARRAAKLDEAFTVIDGDERNRVAVRVVLDQTDGGFSATGNKVWEELRQAAMRTASLARLGLSKLGTGNDGRGEVWPHFISACAHIVHEVGGTPGQNKRFLTLLRKLIPPEMTKRITDEALRMHVARYVPKELISPSRGNTNKTAPRAKRFSS